MSVSKSASERWQGILTQSSPTVVGLCPRPGACGPARPPAPTGRAYVSQGQCSGDPGPRTSSFAPNSTFSPRDCVAVTFDVSQLTTPLQFTFAFVYCVTFRLSRDIYAAAQKSSPNRHRGRTLVNVLQSTPCRPPYVIALARSLDCSFSRAGEANFMAGPQQPTSQSVTKASFSSDFREYRAGASK